MPEEKDYYSKWMTGIQQPKTAPQKPDFYNKWMTGLQPREIQRTTWKQELPSAIGETFKEYIERADFPRMGTLEYWKGTFKNVQESIQDIADLTGFTMTPETRERLKRKIGDLPPESVMAPKRKGLSPEAIEEIVSTGLGKPPKIIEETMRKATELLLWLPKMGIKFASNPVDTIHNDPVGVAFLFMAASPKLRSSFKKKIATKEPINVHEAIKSIPDDIIGKQAKQAVLEGITPDYILDLAKLTTSPAGRASIVLTTAEKIKNAIKEAKPLRKEQEALFTVGRGKRFAEAREVGGRIKGEKGFYAEKAKLKGELPKVEFEPLKLTQLEMDAMFKEVADCPGLNYMETISARTGLAKLFGEYGGRVPQANELALLERVPSLGPEFVKTILSKRSTWDKVKVGILEGVNVPRALMASYDLSFGLRQGVFLAPRYPKEFASAFAKQFKLFVSEKAYRASGQEIASRPTYELMVGGKKRLALMEIDAPLVMREEAVMGAAWGEKIPVIGRGVRASARAYTGFANKYRADIFDHLIKAAEKTGRNPWKDPKLVESIVEFVNTGTGRGSLGALERSAVSLNAFLFSPRLLASRLNLLNPQFYIKLDPFARRQALQSLFAFTGATATTLGLAKLAGLEVGVNPLSADFAKIRVGDTRIDIMGGFQQYLRIASQFMAGKAISTTTGKVTTVGEGYKPLTRLDILSRGLEYKTAPVASFAVNLLRGSTAFGEPINLPEEVGKRFVPMVIQDMIDLAKYDPELFPVSLVGIFGVGLQTYEPRAKGYSER